MTPEQKESLSATANLGITLSSGIVAGFAAAILSHVGLRCLQDQSKQRADRVKPADTLLSQINKGHGPKGSMVYRLITLGKEAGLRGLFAGLGPRMSECRLCLHYIVASAHSTVMTAGLVSSQFLMYGQIKVSEDSLVDDRRLRLIAAARAWSSTRYRDPQGGDEAGWETDRVHQIGDYFPALQTATFTLRVL